MFPDVITPSSGGPLHFLLSAIRWLSGDGYAPHRGCFLGDSQWVTAYVAANWVVALAYLLVALLIAQRMKRAAHIPKTLMGMALLGIFVTCSVGHFLEGITTLAWPGYRLETMWHWMTAIPAWLFLANHNKFSLIVEGPHMIAETREELSRKNQELSILYEQVKETEQLKSAFFANVSHELRTPLTLILGPVESLLTADNLTDAQRHDLQVVSCNARTVLKHVNDLLDISRMEAGRMRIRYVETDLSRLVRLVTSHFDAVLQDREQTLTLHLPDTLTVEVDPDKIERVILNLVSNAIKFVPRGGAIVCRVTEPAHPPTEVGYNSQDDLIIEVEDNGPGIPVELHEAVFERFRQVDNSVSRQYEGTGLGLTIVREFVELHGGDIRVAEAPGGGALFRIRLPRHAPTGVEVVRSKSGAATDVQETLDYDLHTLDLYNPISTGITNPMKTSVHSSTEQQLQTPANDLEKRPLVLVVEDNRDMSAYITQALSPHYRIETAEDGIIGTELAISTRPDIILSDVMMPHRSGDQMVTDLRAIRELDDIPIVLLTARADDDLRIRLLQQGAQDYLTKPFAPEELRARVNNLVSIKRTRQLLQQEIASQQQSLEELASEVAARKRALQLALDEAHAARQVAEKATTEAIDLQKDLKRRNEQLIAAIREAHHRIKNNLQVVTALLEMRVEALNASPIAEMPPREVLPGDIFALINSSIRVHMRQIKSISLIHNLLQPDTDYDLVDLATVLQSMADYLHFALPAAPRIQIQADRFPVHVKVATAVALIVNEIVEIIALRLEDTKQRIQRIRKQQEHLRYDRTAPEISQEAKPSDVIFIQLHHTSEAPIQTILSVEYNIPIISSAQQTGNTYNHQIKTLSTSFDIGGLELVETLVQCDLQGSLRFLQGNGSVENSATQRETGTPGAYSTEFIEIIFPERPQSA